MIDSFPRGRCGGVGPLTWISDPRDQGYTTKEPRDAHITRLVALDGRHAVVGNAVYGYTHDPDHPDHYDVFYYFYLLRRSGNDVVVLDEIEWPPGGAHDFDGVFPNHSTHAVRVSDTRCLFSWSLDHDGAYLFLLRRDDESLVLADQYLVAEAEADAPNIAHLAKKSETEWFFTHTHSDGVSFKDGPGVVTRRVDISGDTIDLTERFIHPTWPWPWAGDEPNEYRQAAASRYHDGELMIAASWNWSGSADYGEQDYVIVRRLDTEGSISLIDDQVHTAELNDHDSRGGFPISGFATYASNMDHLGLDDGRLMIVFRRQKTEENETIDGIIISSDGSALGQSKLIETAHGTGSSSLGFHQYLLSVSESHFASVLWKEAPEGQLEDYNHETGYVPISVSGLDMSALRVCAAFTDARRVELDTNLEQSWSDYRDDVLWVVWGHWLEIGENNPTYDGDSWPVWEVRVLSVAPPLRFEQRDDSEFTNNPNDPRVTTGGQAPTTRQNSIRHSGQTYW